LSILPSVGPAGLSGCRPHYRPSVTDRWRAPVGIPKWCVSAVHGRNVYRL